MPKAAQPSAVSSRYLILMRHAKSDWSEMSLSDHERPLNDRGSRDAPRMARWLQETELVPDLVLCSDSQRTRETFGLMQQEWGTDVEVSYSKTLYLAAPEAILRTIHSDGCGARRLMLLAHNPGITHFVSKLAGQAVEMPTAAVAVFQVALDDWSQLKMGGSATLVQYMRPKAL